MRRIVDRADQGCDLIVWFVRSNRELEDGIEQIKQQVGRNGLWIAWPKKTSSLASDLSQVVVRRVGLAAGLVDYKISAFDDTWTGLKFTLGKGK